MADPLDQIADFPALVEYLRDDLEWPIPEDVGLEEATYDVTPEEIGLKAEAIGGGIEIKQLRPLNRAQPWGVFFLNLPSAKLPVTLVRNILGKLAVKKRASANKAQQAAFAKHDLLFIAATGFVGERRLAFAHFADDEVKGDAATLKVLGWDANDTPRRLGLTEASLKTKLHWPDDPADADRWRRQWGEAFAHSDTRTVIRDSKAMAKALAALARRIRERAKELISAQTEAGSLVKLFNGFREALLRDLNPAGFADLYAQTISYGLLSAAISRSSGALVQENITDTVTITSPFLRDILGMFLEAGGRQGKRTDQALDFDELGVTEVVELLRSPNTDMEAVLADFDRRKPGEDPVTHLYEDFMREYDPHQKVQRGVFYTPRPVVGFIVRSVDEVLRTEFGLEDGLASTATWGEVIAARPEIKLPASVKENESFVRVLDPATGTGTFLVECIDVIHKTMVDKWKAAGKSARQIEALWNDYTPKHLLPRLTGFELMMAPYAIAHVKLGLKLADTGYKFRSDARAQIYLTNALEPAQDLDMQLAFMSEALAREAAAANQAKSTQHSVFVGNPPYKGESANPSKDSRGKLTAAGNLIQHYFTVDGKPLGEANPKWIHNDYIKFLAFAERSILQGGVGVIGYITSHSWLLGGPFRGVRASHVSTYDKLWIVDLHGNIGRRERAPDGSADIGVFEIEEGTNITIGARVPLSREVCLTDLLGSDKFKFEWCKLNTLHHGVTTQIQPRAEMYALQAPDSKVSDVDESFPRLNAVMATSSVGILTSQDELSIHFTEAELRAAMTEFGQLDLSPSQKARSEKSNPKEWKIVFDGDFRTVKIIEKPEARDWQIAWAQREITSLKGKLPVQKILYRPFDVRSTVYTGKSRGFHCMPRTENMGHMLIESPLGLISARSNKTGMADHFLATNLITEAKTGERGTQSNLFPLWLRPQGTETRTLPNIAPAFANRIAALTGLAWEDCVEVPKQGALGGILPNKPEQTAIFAKRRERGEPGRSFGPRDLFDYVYAVFYSPAYRERYADYLKSNFARIPLPGSRALFEALVPLGTELVALHLLDAEALPILKDLKTVRLAGSGEARVAQKPEFNAVLGRVEINSTRWFETVPQVAWDFHVGGYQPAQKWLKDRAAKGGRKPSPGRVLSEGDILHYRQMIVALSRTAELMPKIDEEIEKHGGWPGAFRGMTEEGGAGA